LLGWAIFITLVVCGMCIGAIKPEYDKSKGGGANVVTNSEYSAEYEPIEAKAFAAGGCGAAWKVKKKNSDDDTIYMAKIFSGDADICKATFEPEAKAFEHLDHPNCVKCHKIFGTGKSGDGFVMDLIDGKDLNKAIFLKEMFPEGLTKPQLLNILCQMAEAIRYCHCERFMVHRDLHQGNWMITNDHHITLIDFGIAAILGKNGISNEFWVTE
jgi:eukaryotic-like serine/threonine-protein kinase